MAECEQPVVKKIKLSAGDQPSVSAHLKSTLSEIKKNEIKRAFSELCNSRNWTFNMIKFTSCNANTNSSFSDASSAFTRSTDHGVENRFHLYPFTDVFYRGCDVLRSYLNDGTFIPEDNAQCIALQRLISVVNKIEEICHRLEGVPNDETALTLTLVHHLLKELAVNQDYVIDSQSKHKQKCPCGCEEKITGIYGDTSMGHVDTWHGAVDVLLGNQSVALDIYSVESKQSDEDEENGEDESELGQLCALEFKEANLRRFTNQLIAETIVFAFLQKRRCPEFKTFLIPTVGMSRKQLIFFFYDPQTDIFLETGVHHLFHQIDEPKMIQMPVVLALWLTINYKYFCSGVSEPMLERKFHSLFLSCLSMEKQKLFEDGLQLGSCRRHTTTSSIIRSDLIWTIVHGKPADTSLM